MSAQPRAASLPRANGRASVRPRAGLAWLPVLALGALPLFTSNPYVMGVGTFILIGAIVVVGLDLLLGYGGQLSLGHGVFVSTGAYATALLTTRAGWSGWAAIPAGMVAAGALAAIVGVPTLRLRGYYLAMATLGFPVVFDAVMRNWSAFTGGSSGLSGVPRLSLGGYVLKDAVPYYFVVWVALCAVMLAAALLVRSRFGLALRAVHGDEAAAAARGIDCSRAKVTVFALSAMFAALSGSLYAHYVQFVAPDTFGVLYSIMLVVMLVVGGAGTLWGGVVGTAALMWLPELLRATSTWEPIVFGAALGAVMLFAPKGLAGLFAPAPMRAFHRPATGERRAAREPGSPELLRARGLCKHFGGVSAVEDLDFAIAPGQVKAIIGPNGAGKSTALALFAGTQLPSDGSIVFDGRPIDRLPAHRRARMGLGRGFQHVRLIDGLTVFENVLLGTEADPDGDANEAAAIVERLGLAEVADLRPGEINQYQCRLTEIGAALAGNPSLLLLDEPAAGLSTAEIDRLAELLRAEAARGRSVVLVDHVMRLVMRVADEILVLDHGTTIARDTPARILENPQVVSAYLGTAGSDAARAAHA